MTTTNIQQAQKEHSNCYHVVSSSEVHSFEKREDAISDYEDAVKAEEMIISSFEPVIFAPNGELFKIAE